MKVFTLSLGVVLAAAVLAAEASNTASPSRPAKPAAPLIPLSKKPAKEPMPPLKLDQSVPQTGGIITIDPKLLAAPASPAPQSPMLPPGLTFVPSANENAGLLTINDKNAPLAPGVYTANPYTGIVVAPEPIDAPIVKSPGAASLEIPTREPALRLMPKTK
jgi:hypothetical protein